MSNYSRETRRQIFEEYHEGSSISTIAKLTNLTETAIESAIHSKWFTEYQEDMDQFSAELALGNSEWYLEYKKNKKKKEI